MYRFRIRLYYHIFQSIQELHALTFRNKRRSKKKFDTKNFL